MTKIVVWCGIAFVLLMTGTAAIVFAIKDIASRAFHGLIDDGMNGIVTYMVDEK